MKRKQSQQAIETHNISQRKYPVGPESDLGSTNAIPFNHAEDVDDDGGMSCGGVGSCECGHHGHHYHFEDHGSHMSHFSYTEKRPRRVLDLPSNPGRSK